MRRQSRKFLIEWELRDSALNYSAVVTVAVNIVNWHSSSGLFGELVASAQQEYRARERPIIDKLNAGLFQRFAEAAWRGRLDYIAQFEPRDRRAPHAGPLCQVVKRPAQRRARHTALCSGDRQVCHFRCIPASETRSSPPGASNGGGLWCALRASTVVRMSPHPAEPRHSKGLSRPRAKIGYLVGLFGAVEKTRTSTGFRPQRPQRCASTSSATTAKSTGRARRPGGVGARP